MLVPADLKLLTAWCDARAMRWLPTRTDADSAVLLLEPRVARRPWQRMRLTVTDDGYLLEQESGQALAVASDLPALLDAMDGGVADAAPAVLLQPRPNPPPARLAFA